MCVDGALTPFRSKGQAMRAMGLLGGVGPALRRRRRGRRPRTSRHVSIDDDPLTPDNTNQQV